jgi:hypothetical protein
MVFSEKLRTGVFMKSLLKRRSGNKERQEREGEKLFGLGNLFRSKIKTNLLENISKKKKINLLFSHPRHRVLFI